MGCFRVHGTVVISGLGLNWGVGNFKLGILLLRWVLTGFLVWFDRVNRVDGY